MERQVTRHARHHVRRDAHDERKGEEELGEGHRFDCEEPAEEGERPGAGQQDVQEQAEDDGRQGHAGVDQRYQQRLVIRHVEQDQVHGVDEGIDYLRPTSLTARVVDNYRRSGVTVEKAARGRNHSEGLPPRVSDSPSLKSSGLSMTRNSRSAFCIRTSNCLLA